ncbi:hypothetical protein BO71DRAFT_115519, partial [Aspergillus ellipticus CBS 707.79]
AGPSGRQKRKTVGSSASKRHETQGASPTAGGKRKGGKIRDGDTQRTQQLVLWVDWVPGYDAGITGRYSGYGGLMATTIAYYCCCPNLKVFHVP